MKRIFTGFFLLFCFIAPLSVSFLFLQHQKNLIRKEVRDQMLEGMDRDELVLLRFTEGEALDALDWEHPGEFEFEDRMYDVVITEHTNDSVYYWCWPDHEETMLNAQMDQLIAEALGKNLQSRENQKRLTNFYTSLYFSQINHPELFLAAGGLTGDPGDYGCHSVDYPPPVPPPEKG